MNVFQQKRVAVSVVLSLTRCIVFAIYSNIMQKKNGCLPVESVC